MNKLQAVDFEDRAKLSNLKNAFDEVALLDVTPKKIFDTKNVSVKSAFKFNKG